jgi:predicted Rossmann-fold nucleotide-binding protein
MRKLKPIAMILFCQLTILPASDLAAQPIAKFIRVIAQSTNTKGVTCSNKEIARELTNLGVEIVPDSRLVWADSDKEIPFLARTGKFVICGTRSGVMAGAVLGLIAEEGRPAILLNSKALAATRISLPDNVLKLAKVSL